MKNIADTSIFVYLLDKKLKTIPIAGVSGDINFFFSDNISMNMPLKPVDENSLGVKIPTGFYSCRISLLVFGKTISARFEKQQQIARKK